MWKVVKELTKIRLVYFVLITASCGYFLGLEVEQVFSFYHYFLFLLSLALFTMGSFALNEAQEAELDKKMPRTASRPIPSGSMKKSTAFWIAWALMLFATIVFATLSEPLVYLGWFTVFCYNFLYTKLWKPKWIFAAVPGAIPGAMPVVMGYAAIKPDFLTQEIVYLFLIMFLWQMPHFWSLAIRYKEDYAKGDIPVLPAILGNHTTIYHMGLYLFVYIALALSAPFFLHVHTMYYVLILPFSVVVLWQFYKYQKSVGEKNWLRFFLWVNFSMLAFLLAPVLEKWKLILFRQ
tara:strand:- start:4514 stop:5389 length:876 start_codon:yes stop_codon:yes gene_type:complete